MQFSIPFQQNYPPPPVIQTPLSRQNQNFLALPSRFFLKFLNFSPILEGGGMHHHDLVLQTRKNKSASVLFKTCSCTGITTSSIPIFTLSLRTLF